MSNNQVRGDMNRVTETAIFVSIVFLPIFLPVSIIALLISVGCILKEKGCLLFFIKNKFLVIAILATIFSVLLSTLFAVDRARSSLALFGFLLYPLLLFTISNLEKEKVIKALIIGGLVISIYAVFQWIFDFYPKTHFEIFGKIPVSISGTAIGLQKTNAIPRFLVMVFPLSIALFYSLKDFSWRFSIAALLMFGILALIPTKPLGGMITFILLIFLALFLKNWKFGLAFFVVLLIPLLIRPDIPMKLIEGLTSYTRLKVSVDTWTKFVIPMVKKNPITGCGIGCYTHASRIFGGDFRYMHNHPHSLYFYSLAETGIIGFLSFFYLIFTSLYFSFKRREKDILLLGASFAIMGVLIEGLITSFTEYLPIGMVFWLVLGIVVSDFKK